MPAQSGQTRATQRQLAWLSTTSHQQPMPPESVLVHTTRSIASAQLQPCSLKAPRSSFSCCRCCWARCCTGGTCPSQAPNPHPCCCCCPTADYWPCRGVGVSTSADSCAALSVKPTFTSSCASQRRVVSSLLRQPVNCGLRSRSGRHCRSASRALQAYHATHSSRCDSQQRLIIYVSSDWQECLVHPACRPRPKRSETAALTIACIRSEQTH